MLGIVVCHICGRGSRPSLCGLMRPRARSRTLEFCFDAGSPSSETGNKPWPVEMVAYLISSGEDMLSELIPCLKGWLSNCILFADEETSIVRKRSFLWHSSSTFPSIEIIFLFLSMGMMILGHTRLTYCMLSTSTLTLLLILWQIFWWIY